MLRETIQPGENGHAALHNEERRALNRQGAGRVLLADFGVKGDNRSDDTAGFEAAFTQVPAGWTLCVPPGVFLTSRTLCVPDGVRLSGVSMKASRIVSRAEIALHVGNPDPLITTGKMHENATLHDLDISGTLGLTRHGVRIHRAALFTLERVSVHHCDQNGFDFAGYSWVGALNDCAAWSCANGLAAYREDNQAGNYCLNAVRFIGGRYGNGCEHGVLFDDAGVSNQIGSSIAFRDVIVAGTRGVGMVLANVIGAVVDNGYFEDCLGGAIQIGGSVRPKAVTICHSHVTGCKVPLAVDVRQGLGIRVIGNNFIHGCTVENAVGVRQWPGAEVVIADNFMDQSVDTPVEVA